MIVPYTILRNLNKYLGLTLFAVIFLGSGVVRAQFKGERDRQIVKDVLKNFGKECVQKSTSDSEILKLIGIQQNDAHRLKRKDAELCFENSFSQIAGVHSLFDRLCGDLSSTSAPAQNSDASMARQFILVNKYQLGIRPFHSVLNDCLVNVSDRQGKRFIVPLSGYDLNPKILQQMISEVDVKDPFPATGFPFR